MKSSPPNGLGHILQQDQLMGILSKMEAPNCQRWRLQLSKMEASNMEASNMEASNCQEFGHQLSIFSSLLGSLILATFFLFLL